MPSTARWPRRVVAGLLTAVAFTLTLVALAVPAGAHPYGYPQTVTIAADPDHREVLHVRWKVGGVDELTLLGVQLGLLPQERVMLDGAISFQASDATVLGSSEQFASYLLRQMTVSDGGRSCAGAVEAPVDLVESGVNVDYTCPGPVGKARIEIRMLADLDPAYQTVATGPGGERQVYGPGRYAHDWVLGDVPEVSDAGVGSSIAPRIATVIGGVLLVAVVVLLRRQARRRRAAPARPTS
ncbi:hypothetical protein ACQEUX_29925 [Micromonospora sp. CA-259024]|uniref:hypothetical protein n=1 Tax=Micromonospora sp. CA-259024 TaxID=3239965 RepID=UPI003D8DDFF7